MEIAPSARKHRISDDDIRHAVQMPLRLIDQEDNLMLIIGPDRSGRLLEVVVLDPHETEGESVAIHAMRLRQSLHGYLR